MVISYLTVVPPEKAVTRAIKVTLAIALIATSALVVGVWRSWGANACEAMVNPIYQRTGPAEETLLTPWKQEAEKAAQTYGYSRDLGTPFAASTTSAPGLVPIHRLYRAASNDFMWIAAGAEKDSAIGSFGYTDAGVNFYALPSPSGCGVPVVRFLKGPRHQYAVSQQEQDALTNAGWTKEGVAFYGARTTAATADPTATDPAATDSVFGLAALPDTQNEVHHPSDTRSRDRMQWLVSNQKTLDLRYVLHSGDVTNWGWLEPSQYQVADRAFAILDQAKIPYQAAIGNHDTRAVGYNGDPKNPGPGGSAYMFHPDCPKKLGADQCNTAKLVRQTQEWNATFPSSRFVNVGGTFEPNKSDNMYQTFSAGGVDWLVLTLELYPRKEAVAWASEVVKANPKRNVIVVTHSYLTGSLDIRQDAEYGATSPQYLFDNLIKVYPNIKMVFCGHTGQWGTKIHQGANGNTIVSYLTALHSSDNPVRTLEINTATGLVTSKLVTPNRGTSQPDNTQVTLSLVR